jgi:predicted TIM-barrel fold metal-dependent hydrolase
MPRPIHPFQLALTLGLLTLACDSQDRQPIIDMHLHASAVTDQGPPPVSICAPFDEMITWDPSLPYDSVFGASMRNPPCRNFLVSPMTDEDLMKQTIAVMERRNVYGVLCGTTELVSRWSTAAPGRFYPGVDFVLFDGPPADSLRMLHQSGHLAVFAEVQNQYAGVAPDDERMEPYWALAEELDIPVGIHIGPGPPGVINLGAGNYRARMHSALTLEEVLVRHPRLRVYVMHAGFPMLDDLLAVLYAHPQVYIDVGIIVYAAPRAHFYRYLQAVMEAGYGKRVLFGSDQMVWPEAIERSIETIEQAPFLTEAQRRDIFYNNAARFLRLSDQEIARHRRG